MSIMNSKHCISVGALFSLNEIADSEIEGNYQFRSKSSKFKFGVGLAVNLSPFTRRMAFTGYASNIVLGSGWANITSWSLQKNFQFSVATLFNATWYPFITRNWGLGIGAQADFGYFYRNGDIIVGKLDDDKRVALQSYPDLDPLLDGFGIHGIVGRFSLLIEAVFPQISMSFFIKGATQIFSPFNNSINDSIKRLNESWFIFSLTAGFMFYLDGTTPKRAMPKVRVLSMPDFPADESKPAISRSTPKPQVEMRPIPPAKSKLATSKPISEPQVEIRLIGPPRDVVRPRQPVPQGPSPKRVAGRTINWTEKLMTDSLFETANTFAKRILINAGRTMKKVADDRVKDDPRMKSIAKVVKKIKRECLMISKGLRVATKKNLRHELKKSIARLRTLDVKIRNLLKSVEAIYRTLTD